MKLYWFRRTSWGFMPSTLIAWVITIAGIAFCLQISWFYMLHTNSVSDFLYHIYPYIIPTYLLWCHIAERTCAD
jgi:hypothetical protein